MQGVPEGTVNILGGGNMDYSELSRPPWETRARGFFLPFFSPFKAVV